MPRNEIADHKYYSLMIDPAINRLYIKILGFAADTGVIDSYIADQKRAVAKLRPSFTIVADMREFKTLPQEFLEKQEASQQDLAAAGVYRVAEILPDSVIASAQLDRVTKKTKMPNRQFSTIEEAEKWLDAEVEKLENGS